MKILLFWRRDINLVGYKKDDPYMHVWVKRDEYMDDDFIDNILYDYEDCSIPAKYDAHY